MSHEVQGELVPVGGGDPIPLIRGLLTIGRRESCDICMRFPNISGMHAELTFRDGYWYIRDMGSTNGVKVNGSRVMEKLVYPTDEITLGKRGFTLAYELPANRRAIEELEEDILSQPLLERAGLVRPERKRKKRPSERSVDAAEFLLRDDDAEEK